jgi:hypothetical protein
MTEMVWHGFFINSSLRHFTRTQGTLSVDHGGDNRKRLDQVLEQRNRFMAGTGQEMWPHACYDCQKIFMKDGIPRRPLTLKVLRS